MDNKLAFEIPLTNVSHTTTAKNEVTLEFHQNDDASVSLTELRFHIPSDNTENDPVQVMSCGNLALYVTLFVEVCMSLLTIKSSLV